MLDYVTCDYCHQRTDAPQSFLDKTVCPSCVASFQRAGLERPQPARPVRSGEYEEDHRYPALEAVASMGRGLAWVVLIIAVFVAFASLAAGPVGIVAAGASVAMGLVGYVLLRACAESIVVLIDIERNTRGTAR